MASAAVAQSEQPMSATSTSVDDALAVSPQITIGNGQITARIASPDLQRGFYRGAGSTKPASSPSPTFRGRSFYGPWFDHTSPDVLDYTYDAEGRVVAGADSATSGPVEFGMPRSATLQFYGDGKGKVGPTERRKVGHQCVRVPTGL
jgi:hypothetical protein